MAGTAPDGPEGDSPGADRLLALTDGVVAISLTLLVLQLVVPVSSAVSDPTSPAALFEAMWGQGRGQFFIYSISFALIAAFWLTHHRIFHTISGHSSGLAWANFAFLFFVSLMPFTSELLGRFPDNPFTVSAFAVGLLGASLSTLGLRYFAKRHGLLRADVDHDDAANRWQVLGASTVILCSIPIAWVSPIAGIATWALIIPAPRMLQAVMERRRRTVRSPPSGSPWSEPDPRMPNEDA